MAGSVVEALAAAIPRCQEPVWPTGLRIEQVHGDRVSCQTRFQGSGSAAPAGSGTVASKPTWQGGEVSLSVSAPPGRFGISPQGPSPASPKPESKRREPVHRAASDVYVCMYVQCMHDVQMALELKQRIPMTYIHAHTNMCACMHPCIHAYIHTYTHTYGKHYGKHVLRICPPRPRSTGNKLLFGTSSSKFSRLGIRRRRELLGPKILALVGTDWLKNKNNIPIEQK